MGRVIKYYLFLLSYLGVFNSIFITDISAEALKLVNLGVSPNISGVDQNNKDFNYDPKISGNLTLVNFFFTSCHGPCPVLMENVSRLITSSNCDKLSAISITVDPETDTPEVLKEYSNSRKFTDKRWSLLKTSKEDLDYLLNKGFKLGSGPSFAEHTVRIVLTDSKGDIRILKKGNLKESESDEVSQLRAAIHELCPK